MSCTNNCNCNHLPLGENGNQPFIVNINDFAKCNDNFITDVWTGDHLQTSVMSLPCGEEIGPDVLWNTDLWLTAVDGCATVRIGDREYSDFVSRQIDAGTSVMIPAGTWHHIINSGNKPLKLIACYTPMDLPVRRAKTSQQNG